MRNVQLLREGQRADALEALLQVRLHARWVLGLREDFQQLVVGQEEEAREIQALLLQIPAQSE